MRGTNVLLVGVVALLAATQSGAAQSWPDKPVKVVVPYGPGGPTDVIARIIADKLGSRSKQTVVIENRPGAGSNIGTTAVARAAPDGTTLLVNTSAVAVNQTLFKSPGYDALKDLTAIVNVGQSPNVVIGSKALEATTLKGAIDAARAGKLSYGSPGTGTTPHLSMEYLFKVLAKADVRHVPFKGGNELMNALLSGSVPLGCGAVPTVFAQVAAGEVRGLGVTSARRVASLPNVPTVAEAGFPGFEDYTWMAVFAPGGMQPGLAARINAEVVAILALPDVRDRLGKIGFEIVGGSQESFTRYVAIEVAKWAKVVKSIGATPL
jgi:tripartite-type tricarboxylate transporter receptor subunit TctC